MREMQIVYGNSEQAKPLIIGVDTVYVHTNIEPVAEHYDGTPATDLFKYNEVQYTKDEYIQLMFSNQIQNQMETDTLLVDLYYKTTLLELGVI